MAIETGLNELRTGIRCLDSFQQRGRKKSEVLNPQLEADIRELVELHTQSDPKFQTPLAFTRATAPAVHAALSEKYEQTVEKVPSCRTVLNILNRLGYRLKRVQKTRPEKKSPKPTPFSKTSKRPINDPPATRRT